MTTIHGLAVTLLVIFAVSIRAHMQLTFPAPFNASNNPFRTTTADPYLQYPYDCCGPSDRWSYPCRGYLSLLDTPQGAPTATWQAGSTQSWNISGIGNHYGGSCQVGFSIDRGDTFRVATSYEGNCPHRNAGDGPEGQDFGFTVPADISPGVQVFAWIWYNREQEFNMNCAAVNITAPSSPAPSSYGLQPASSTIETRSSSSSTSTAAQTTYTTANNCTCVCSPAANISTCDCSCPSDCQSEGTKPVPAREVHHQHRHKQRGAMATPTSSSATALTDPTPFTPFDNRPLMLIADDGNGCLTPKSTAEVKYPNPGPDVVTGDGVYPLELPSGNCTAMPGDQS